MKILFIVFNIIGRGTYLRAFELGRALTKLGHSVTILASSRDIRKKTQLTVHQGIQIITVSDLFRGPLRSGWDIGNLLSRIRIIKPLQFDLVHGFESRPTVIYPALAIRKKANPLFLDWADWFGSGGSVEERPNPVVRNLLRPVEDYYETNFRNTALGTTVICKTLEQRAKQFKIPAEDICVLPNGFDMPDWQAVSIQQARLELNLENTGYLIGYLGSLFPGDADLAAQTINLLGKQDLLLQMLHVGQSNYHMKRKVNHPESIIETGPVDFHSMQTYLSACDVLWLPFRDCPANNGRFPLKFSNYLSCGRPIIATNVGDIPGYIKQENLGIVTEDNPESMANAIIHLQNNPALRSIFGQSAVKLSQDPKESWSSRADTLINFYKEKIEGIK